MHLRYIFVFLFYFIGGSALISQPVFTETITAEDVKAHISYLASDELAGRYPGTPGSYAAAVYIREQFISTGLTLLGDDGLQIFDAVVSVKEGANSFQSGDITGTAGEDFGPFPFSASTTLEAGVVFAGYGFDFQHDSLSWNDYENVDVAGNWVMLFRGDPEMDQQDSYFSAYGEDRDKVITARDKGAAGVLFVSGSRFDEQDKLVSVYFDKSRSDAGIPVIHLKRSLADQLLMADQITIDGMESLLASTYRPASQILSARVKARTEIIHEVVPGRNVIGMIEGNDPVLRESYIIIGAHYDHLGMGGQGSGSRFMDSTAIHYGADDNASGVAGVLELAAMLASDRSSLKRSIVFIAFDAEELGLLGSKYFVNNPLVDLNTVMAMINLDMIGRLKEDDPAIMVGGSGTSKESQEILESLETGGVSMTYSPEGYGPSDHASFYGEDITVFFFTTGAHEDYHTPNDRWELINFEGTAAVIEIAADLIFRLANREEYLSFRQAGPKQQGSRGGYRLKATLGIMPDFTATTKGGLGVGGVRADGPAYKGGMLKGDIITAIDGKPVNDIYDYMNRLQRLNPGQVISVDVMRGDEKLVLIIQL
ncbi:MAG: M20/M25/M40 family metallo-hydrolase [Bacteroidales bacterium]|jgi:aminopeptidase YwaD